MEKIHFIEFNIPMFKTLNEIEIKRPFFNLASSYPKVYRKIIFNSEILNPFSMRLGVSQKFLVLPFIFKNSLKIFASKIKQEKKSLKRIWIGKKERELSLFAEDMILYLEYSEESTGKLLDE